MSRAQARAARLFRHLTQPTRLELPSGASVQAVAAAFEPFVEFLHKLRGVALEARAESVARLKAKQVGAVPVPGSARLAECGMCGRCKPCTSRLKRLCWIPPPTSS